MAEGTHPTADSVGELSGIALDRAGNVYVSDFSAATVWVFDRTGRSVARVGRRGRGPGAFLAPTGIAVGPDERLWVRDTERVTRFARDRATGLLTRHERSFPGPPFADWRSTGASRFDTAGRMYYPAFNTIDRSRRTGWYYRYVADGRLVDSLEVPPFPQAPPSTAYVQLNEHGGRMLRGLNHVPFAPLPVWDVTARSTLIRGDGQTYVLVETDSGGRQVRVYRRDVPADRIPSGIRRDSTAALRARLDSVPVSPDRVKGMPAEVRDVRLPEAFPPYMAVYATPDTAVWVRRWPPGGASRSIFDVFGPDGRLLAVVVLPREIAVEPTPVLSLDGVAAVAVDRETGAHAVLRFASGPGR